jgi:hypothetical protein
MLRPEIMIMFVGCWSYETVSNSAEYPTGCQGGFTSEFSPIFKQMRSQVIIMGIYVAISGEM